MQVEWTFGRIEADLLVDLASGAGEFTATDTGALRSESERLDLERPDHWRRLSERLARLRLRGRSAMTPMRTSCALNPCPKRPGAFRPALSTRSWPATPLSRCDRSARTSLPWR